MDKKTLAENLLLCRKHTKACARILFPHHFTRPFDAPHDLIFEKLDRPKISAAVFKDKGLRQSKTVIASPRGTGKTTLTNLVFAARAILFGTARYIVMIGASQAAAIEQAETLKNELIENETIYTLFGDVRSDTFAQDRWDVIVGRTDQRPNGHHRVRVLPIGPGGKIRGRKQGTARPDLILIDDLENDENVESELQREKLEHWLNAAVLNSIDRGKDWQIVMIGTLLRHDSLLAKLLDPEYSPGWNRLRLSICDPDYNTLWPNYMSTAEIEELIRDHRRRGALSQFSREYMNSPVPDEERKFRPEMWQYYDEAEEDLNRKQNIATIISIDPARTMKAGSCRTAIVGVGVDRFKHVLYVREVLAAKLSPAELIAAALEMCIRLNAGALAVEETGLHEYIKQPILNELSKRNMHLRVFWINPRDKKEVRSGALLPYYEQGRVKHNKVSCGKLEHRLEEWPRCAEWDEVDAFAQVIAAMEKDEMYFYPDGVEETEEEYTRMYQEDAQIPALDGWMYA